MTERAPQVPVETRKTDQELADQLQRITTKLGRRALAVVELPRAGVPIPASHPREKREGIYTYNSTRDQMLFDYEHGLDTAMLGATIHNEGKKKGITYKASSHRRQAQIPGKFGLHDVDTWAQANSKGTVELNKRLEGEESKGTIKVNVDRDHTNAIDISGVVERTDESGKTQRSTLNKDQIIAASAGMLSEIRSQAAEAETHYQEVGPLPPERMPRPTAPVNPANEMLNKLL